VDRVVVDPTAADQIVLVARWPAHPGRQSLLVLEVDPGAARRLAEWCDRTAVVSPLRLDDSRVTLRRRRTMQSVEARIIVESPWLAEAD